MYKNVSKNIAEGGIEGVNHGRKVILPVNYSGSVRWYRLECRIHGNCERKGQIPFIYKNDLQSKASLNFKGASTRSFFI